MACERDVSQQPALDRILRSLNVVGLVACQPDGEPGASEGGDLSRGIADHARVTGGSGSARLRFAGGIGRSRRDTAAWRHERSTSNRTVTLSGAMVTVANVGLMTDSVSSDVRLDRLLTLLICRSRRTLRASH